MKAQQGLAREKAECLLRKHRKACVPGSGMIRLKDHCSVSNTQYIGIVQCEVDDLLSRNILQQLSLDLKVAINMEKRYFQQCKIFEDYFDCFLRKIFELNCERQFIIIVPYSRQKGRQILNILRFLQAREILIFIQVPLERQLVKHQQQLAIKPYDCSPGYISDSRSTSQYLELNSKQLYSLIVLCMETNTACGFGFYHHKRLDLRQPANYLQASFFESDIAYLVASVRDRLSIKGLKLRMLVYRNRLMFAVFIIVCLNRENLGLIKIVLYATLYWVLITDFIEKLFKQQIMLNLIKPRHLSQLKRSSNKENCPKHKEQKATQSSSPPKKTTFSFKRSHHNATRTRVTQFLEYKSDKIKILHNPSFWLLSKTYLKRLQTCQNVPENSEPKESRRKISWSEESEFIYFNQRKHSASVSQASRHFYPLDQ